MKMKALLTLIILLCLIPNVVCHVLTIATYNLWNVMFNWDVRKYRIAQMVMCLQLYTEFFCTVLLPCISWPRS